MTAAAPARAAAEEVFTGVYLRGQWHMGSGSGSMPWNTWEYRRYVATLIRLTGARSVLDLGCGDFRVGRGVDLGAATYLGVDCVPSLAERNARFYGTDRIRFAHGDILTAPLPPADLVLVKDLLQHWPDEAIHELGARLAGYPRVLLTYDHRPAGEPHRDTELGGHRPLDLLAPPFSWEGRHVLSYVSVSHEGAVRRAKTVTLLICGSSGTG